VHLAHCLSSNGSSDANPASKQPAAMSERSWRRSAHVVAPDATAAAAAKAAAAPSLSSSTSLAVTAAAGRRTHAKRKQAPPPPKKKNAKDSSVRNKKRQQGSGAKRSTTPVDSPPSVNCFNWLDDNCRIKIFSYSAWQDLAEAAQTARAFRDDCRHPSLTQNADRQMVLTVRGECGDLYRRLASMADSNRLVACTRLKVVRGGQVRFTPEDAAARIRGGRTIPQVTSLELSLDTSDGTPGVAAADWYTVYYLGIRVAEYLPHLRHLTVSDGLVRPPGARGIYEKCPNLASLTWRNQPECPFLEGHLLGRFCPVRCLDMDGCTFSVAPYRSPRILHYNAGTLERVSIRNARCYVDRPYDSDDEYEYDAGTIDVWPIPQQAIVEFARLAPNLRWLRSDLTPDNVAMLQLERPDVAFVS
jgi:hypothetical protein